MKQYTAQSAFTFVELIIYIAISSIILVSIMTFSVNILSSAEKSEIQQETLQNARFAMEKISQSIRKASDIDGSTSTFDVHPSSLTLTMEDPLKDPTIFNVSGGMLFVTQGSATPLPLLDDSLEVTELIFTDLSRPNYTKSIGVDLTVRHKNYSESTITNAEIKLRSTATIRTQSD